MNNNEVIECKHYCPNYYSDDIGHEEKDRINACGLTRTGYHEMSYKKCSDVPNCYFKQLLQLKTENDKLTQKLEKAREALENIKARNYCHYLGSYLLSNCNNCLIGEKENCNKFIAQQALKELNT